MYLHALSYQVNSILFFLQKLCCSLEKCTGIASSVQQIAGLCPSDLCSLLISLQGNENSAFLLFLLSNSEATCSMVVDESCTIIFRVMDGIMKQSFPTGLKMTGQSKMKMQRIIFDGLWQKIYNSNELFHAFTQCQSVIYVRLNKLIE